MARLLTDEEWKAQKPPIVITRLSYKSWTDTHYELVEKWVLENCEGWVYFKRHDRAYLFGLESDATLLDLWLEEGVLERERARIPAKDEA